MTSEVVDLNLWELQLPIKNGDSIEIIKPNDLVSYISEYFYKVDESIAFWCPTNGATTENSKYPRSELREEYEWDLQKGYHNLTASCKVIKVAKNKGIIIGQVHGTNSKLNPQLAKLYYDVNGNIYLEHKNDKSPSSKQIKVSLGKADLGDTFYYSLNIKDSTLIVSVNDNTKTIKFKNSYWKKQKYYYKAGNYTQDNKGDDYGLVIFDNIQVDHK